MITRREFIQIVGASALIGCGEDVTLRTIPGQSFQSGSFSSVAMSVATADVPPESLVYGRAVAINDIINYSIIAPKDDINNPENGPVTVDTLGVPTITASYGMYEITFDFDGGASETYKWPHTQDAVVLANFTLPAQDAEGYSIEPTPESTARLLYVDPTLGNDTNAAAVNSGDGFYTTGNLPGGTWDIPTGITPYQNWDTAKSLWRDGQGDYLLILAGETIESTAATGGWTLQAGKSHTFPHVISSYGAARLTSRPVWRANPDTGSQFNILSTGTDDNYNHIYNINFHAQYRDPAHGDYVGAGLTQFAAEAINFQGFTGSDIDGLHVENCIFDHNGVTFATSNILRKGIFRRNIFRNAYSEWENAIGLFANNCTLLIEENLFYHNGWLINVDTSTYPNATIIETHDGSNGATTFSDATASFDSKILNAVVGNTTTGEFGRVDTQTSTTFTATFSAADGGGSMTFDNGEAIKIVGPRLGGQASGFNHNLYLPLQHGTIVRDNLILGGSSSGIKLTAIPSEASDPGAPYTTISDDICIYNNYFAGNPVDLSADLNSDAKDWQTRFKDFRFMNNVCTKSGFYNQAGIDDGQGIASRWWDASCIGGNVFTKIDHTALAFGMTIARISTDIIISRNVFYDIGAASGTNTGGSRGLLSFSPGAFSASGHQILYNDFQCQNTDHKLIGDLASGEGFTWLGNRYFSTRAAASWAELDDVDKTITQLVADTGETGYSETSVTYTNAQTHEGYMTDIGEGTTTIDQMAISAAAMMVPGSWDTDYEAKYIVVDFKLGYK